MTTIRRNENSRASHAVVGEEEPEAENWLGENVKNGIRDNLGIDTSDTGTIGNTPNAMTS